jgi:hypothetical protein
LRVIGWGGADRASNFGLGGQFALKLPSWLGLGLTDRR